MLSGVDSEDDSIGQLLQGGWIRTHYARRRCPTTVSRWLFAVACHHRQAHMSAAGARTLSALLSNTELEPEWVPQPADFLGALHSHGASISELVPAMSAPPPPSTTSGVAEGAPPVEDPRQNVLATLELLPPCARLWPGVAPPDEQVVTYACTGPLMPALNHSCVCSWVPSAGCCG